MLMRHQHRLRYRQYYAARALPIPDKPHAWQRYVDELMFAADTAGWTVLDYGCGPQAALSHFAWYPVTNYDPGTSAYARLPHSADLVVCWHVLEHVEPDCLAHVLRHLRKLARQALLVAVSCQSSTKVLLDGTPWHTIVEHPDWWAQTLTAAWGVTPETRRFPAMATEYRGLFLLTKGEEHE